MEMRNHSSARITYELGSEKTLIIHLEPPFHSLPNNENDLRDLVHNPWDVVFSLRQGNHTEKLFHIEADEFFALVDATKGLQSGCIAYALSDIIRRRSLKLAIEGQDSNSERGR